MKKNALMLFLLATILVQGQPPRIQFSYDAAGNQVLREICMNCAARTTNHGVPIVEKTLFKRLHVR